MAHILEIKYFNSFTLKKLVEKSTPTPNQEGSWPGLPWNPSFITSTGIKKTYPTFPWNSPNKDAEESTNWYVEEARIKGGFNNSIVDLGVRAYTVSSNVDQVSRKSSLIFSGIFNNRTGVNNTNVFSISENIIKDANPKHGSIQKIYAEDTNLIVFQENKVHYALINKNTIYTGDQGAEEVTGVSKVIGQLVPYLGEYGISRNPESFAIHGYRKYFADKDRSAILRLSRDGITEISAYGMRKYFRSKLAAINDDRILREVYVPITPNLTSGNYSTLTLPNIDGIEVGSQVVAQYINNSDKKDIVTPYVVVGISSPTSVAIQDLNQTTLPYAVDPTEGEIQGFRFRMWRRDKIYAGYDAHNKNYTLSMQTSPRFVSTADISFDTLSFDENINGWTSFYSYKPTFIDSLKNKFYTFIDDEIYQHYVAQGNNHCMFYGNTTPDEASVKLIFNPNPSVKKNFNTISYEGSNGWEVESIESSFQGFDDNLEYHDVSNPIKSYAEGAYLENGVTLRGGFDRKENRYVSDIINASGVRPGEVIFGDGMSGVKGYFTTVKFKVDSSTNVGGMKELFLAGSNYVMSSY